MIEAGFEGEATVLCLKFNDWRFQGFEDAKIALIEGIVTGLIEKRPALTKAGEAVKDVFRRIDWLKVAKKAGGPAFTAFTGIPTPDQIQTIVGTLESFLADPAKLATKDNLEAAVEGAKGLLTPRRVFFEPAKESAKWARPVHSAAKAAGPLSFRAGLAITAHRLPLPTALHPMVDYQTVRGMRQRQCPASRSSGAAGTLVTGMVDPTTAG